MVAFGEQVGVDPFQFPRFRTWLSQLEGDATAQAMAEMLGDRPDFPEDGSFSEIRRFFDEIFRHEDDLHEYAMAMTLLWLTERKAYEARMG